MSKEKTIQLMLQVDIEDADREELDFQTRQLLREIRAQDVESAELTSRPPEQGTKALGATELGSIVVELGPTVFPMLFSAVSSWVNRDRSRSVKFKGEISGKIVEFEGDLADFKRLLTMIKQLDANT